MLSAADKYVSVSILYWRCCSVTSHPHDSFNFDGFNSLLEMRNRPYVHQLGRANQFQFSIGDAPLSVAASQSRNCPMFQFSIGDAVTISEPYPHVVLGFQFSIGDAAALPPPCGGSLLPHEFQFSIGDAREDEPPATRAGGCFNSLLEMQRRRRRRRRPTSSSFNSLLEMRRRCATCAQRR